MSGIIKWLDDGDEPPDRRVFSDRIVRELRAHSGRWGLVRDYAGYNRGWKPKHPPDIELRWISTSNPGRTELWARARPQSERIT